MSNIDDVLDYLNFKMKPLNVAGIKYADEIVITGKNKVKDQLYKDMLELIPANIDTTKYSYEESAQDFMLGYTQACIEIEAKLNTYFGRTGDA